MRRNFDRYYDDALQEKSLYNRRLLTLVMAEMLLKYQIFLDTPDGQYMVDSIIKCLLTTRKMKEYTQRLKVLSDSHRLKAQQEYIVFLFKGPLCLDVAHHIASFV
jgi:hypothetical protein